MQSIILFVALYGMARPTRFELTTPKIRSKNKRQLLFYINPQPLNADAFEDQMFFLASHGYRVIAHDRRGHGRSSQLWHGNDMRRRKLTSAAVRAARRSPPTVPAARDSFRASCTPPGFH
jgi:pimeloyl-ACP methyl ester carboxylesterase